ncbi:MAG: hypothetical protein F6K04_02300 [Leptolyngbya sp. SIO4C5]|nr:hypothetical protein [Leptolyngbya sp. SIO4C5]
MVDKRRRIAKKPDSKAAADEWINEGGVDPEIEPTQQPVEAPQVEPEQGKPKYPHRISFDMGKAQYKRLKWAAFDSDRSMNEILREAVEDWMKLRDY